MPARPPGGTGGWWGAGSRIPRRWCGSGSCLEDIGAEGREALAVEADRLTQWLAGERVGTVYPSALMRATDLTRADGSRRASVATCANSLSNKPRRCSDCGSATPSVDASASPATVTSVAPSSEPSSEPGCRWPIRRDSTPIPASPMPVLRRPARRARRSTSRSPWPRWSIPMTYERSSRRRCPMAWTSSRSSNRRGGSLSDLLHRKPLADHVGRRPRGCGAGRRRLPLARGGHRRTDDEEGPAGLQLPCRGDLPHGRRSRSSTWCCGTRFRPSGPTTSSPDSPPRRVRRRRGADSDATDAGRAR